MKKYVLIKESKTMFMGREVFRVKALKNFGNVKAGDVGGWVCSENNLSQEGDCWIYDDAKCLDNARVYDNAEMYGEATMCDNAVLDKNKLLYGSINKSYKKIFQHHCEVGLLTVILTEENEILYSIGCRTGMTKEKFIDMIYNYCKIKGKGLEEYPYRQEYLDMIDIAESSLKKFI